MHGGGGSGGLAARYCAQRGSMVWKGGHGERGRTGSWRACLDTRRGISASREGDGAPCRACTRSSAEGRRIIPKRDGAVMIYSVKDHYRAKIQGCGSQQPRGWGACRWHGRRNGGSRGSSPVPPCRHPVEGLVVVGVEAGCDRRLRHAWTCAREILKLSLIHI